MELESLPDNEKWQTKANCLDVEINVFFPLNGKVNQQTKEFCDMCPVRVECLEFALANNYNSGIYGGMGEAERRAILKERERLGKVAVNNF